VAHEGAGRCRGDVEDPVHLDLMVLGLTGVEWTKGDPAESPRFVDFLDDTSR
jgi:hypothetical protein